MGRSASMQNRHTAIFIPHFLGQPSLLEARQGMTWHGMIKQVRAVLCCPSATCCRVSFWSDHARSKVQDPALVMVFEFHGPSLYPAGLLFSETLTAGRSG